MLRPCTSSTSLSVGQALIAGAVLARAAPRWATADTHPAVRKQYKTVSLGVLYGQTEYGIAARLGVSLEEARRLLEAHRALFPAYWAWSEAVVQAAFDRGEIRTARGWGCRVPFGSNERTWRNCPCRRRAPTSCD